MLSGIIAALAGVILTSRLSSARADAGQGMTLTVVTVVLLGGVNIFGGRGTIPGVVLAVLVVAVMQNALRLAQRDGRGPEHRPRAAADPLGRHPHLCSPGQVGRRPHPPRSATAGGMRSHVVSKPPSKQLEDST